MTTPHKPITDWHRQRAAELVNASDPTTCRNPWTVEDFREGLPPGSVGMALLQYIADHEDPPADPDLLAAREIVAKACRDRVVLASEEDVLNGSMDALPPIQMVLEAIRYGRGHP